MRGVELVGKRADLTNTMYHMNLTDMYRTFCLTTIEYTFFSSVWRTFSRMDLMLGHKTSLSKFKKNEITPSMSSDHNSVKCKITERKMENSQTHRN